MVRRDKPLSMFVARQVVADTVAPAIKDYLERHIC
jgi:hypothetical protein